MLEVNIASIRLKHPLMNASGVLGNSPGGIKLIAKLGFAAAVTKTITPEPREGFKPPVMVRLPNGGLLNAIGLANPGKSAIKDFIKAAKESGIPIFVSVAGKSSKEYAEVAVKAEECGASGVELNLSCPHTKGYGLEFGRIPSLVRRVVYDVSSVVNIPVLAKLGLSDRIIECAGAALDAGASGLVLINTVKALFIDVYSLRPFLTAVYGGLSGPPIHPIAVRVVYDVFSEFNADIIGVGGVYNWETAAELIAAGAKAIQIGTALMDRKDLVTDIINGLSRWLSYHGVKSVADLVGAAAKR